jgi:hypothetical protein
VPTRYQRNTEVVTRKVAEETIVVPLRGGVGDLDGLFTLNEIGSEIWRLLGDGRTAEEIAGWVAEHYEVSESQARTDVNGFLAGLQEQGLVRPA